jgi:DNA-binding CsgD family transcriptional regulator
MALTAARHKPFIDETPRLVEGALGATWLAFYTVDQQRNLTDFVLGSGVPRGFHESYLRGMSAFDPLHVRRIGQDVQVARLGDASRYAPPGHVGRYGRFLRDFAAVDALELIFRDEGAIVAGLNVTWSERDALPSATSHALAQHLQHYIQFTLASQAASARSWLEVARSFGLTPREREVSLLVCQGHTNAEIATRLGIELSTVKTHLLRIFEKCAVDSRAGLVGRLADCA